MPLLAIDIYPVPVGNLPEARPAVAPSFGDSKSPISRCVGLAFEKGRDFTGGWPVKSLDLDNRCRGHDVCGRPSLAGSSPGQSTGHSIATQERFFREEVISSTPRAASIKLLDDAGLFVEAP